MDHGVLVNGAVHNPCRSGGHRLLQHGLQLLLGAAPCAPQAVGLGQLDEVGAPVQVGLGIPLTVDQMLPLADHAQGVVVENQDNHRDVVVLHGAQLVAVHAEAAVAGAEEHGGVRVAHLGAHGGPQAEAHGAEAAGGDELAGPVEMVVLGGPHLVLAHIGGHNGPGGHRLDGLQHLVGVEDAVLFQGQLLVGEHPLLPLGVVVGGQLLVEQLQHPPGVADDVVVGLDVLVHLRPVDVNLDNFGLPGKGLGVGGHPVGEPAANGDEQVALVGGVVGGVGAVHADHAGKEGVVARAGAAAHDGGGHRGVQPLKELAELGHRAPGADHAAAHQDQGLSGLLNHVQQLLDVAVVGLGGAQVVGGPAEHGGQAAVLAVLAGGQVLVLRLLVCNVFENINQHRAGAAGAGDGKGLPDHVGQVLRPADQVVALGDGHGDAGDIHLLEGVLADKVLRHVDRDEHHGGGVVVGGGDAGGQVGGAGTAGGKAHAHLSGGAGVSVGGVGGPLLMGGQNMVNLLLVSVKLQLIVDVQNGAAGIAEYGVHPLLQQAFHQNLRGFHLHICETSFGFISTGKKKKARHFVP